MILLSRRDILELKAKDGEASFFILVVYNENFSAGSVPLMSGMSSLLLVRNIHLRPPKKSKSIKIIVSPKNHDPDDFCLFSSLSNERSETISINSLKKIRKELFSLRKEFSEDLVNSILNNNKKIYLVFEDVLSLPWFEVYSFIELEKRLKNENSNFELIFFLGNFNKYNKNHLKIRGFLSKEGVSLDSFLEQTNP